MKTLPLAAALAVAATAAAAHDSIVVERIVVADRDMVVVADDLLKIRPVWSYKLDRSVLYPVPRPFPWPVPPCLSCPPFGIDERVTTPVLR